MAKCASRKSVLPGAETCTDARLYLRYAVCSAPRNYCKAGWAEQWADADRCFDHDSFRHGEGTLAQIWQKSSVCRRPEYIIDVWRKIARLLQRAFAAARIN